MQSLSKIERGVNYPTFDTLEKIMDVLEVTPNELAEGRVARLCLTAAEQRLPDAGAELCGGGVGEGDDEEPVGVHGMAEPA